MQLAENQLAPTYLRQAAVDAMSYENNWFDPSFIKHCLTQRDETSLLIGALFAVFEMVGPRQRRFMTLVVDALQHEDPMVVLLAIDIIRLRLLSMPRLRKSLAQLEGDKRYSTLYRSTVGDAVADLI